MPALGFISRMGLARDPRAAPALDELEARPGDETGGRGKEHTDDPLAAFHAKADSSSRPARELSMTQSRWDRVRAHALALPQTIEDFPWGESVVKIDYPQRKGADGLAVGPMFAWLGRPERSAVSVKLDASYEEAVSVGGATPTTMSGLGKWGWLTIPLGNVDLELLSDWLEESYRGVAPKRLLADLMAGEVKDTSRSHRKRQLPGRKPNQPNRR